MSRQSTRGALQYSQINSVYEMQESYIFHLEQINHHKAPTNAFCFIMWYLGCKPFQEKNLEIEILCSSDSVFSPDSENSFQKS